MQHLTLEELARFLDEPLTIEASAHVAECVECASELEAMRNQADGLVALRAAVPPPELWTAIEGELRRERVIAEKGRPVWSWPLQIAAAVSIFVLGSLSGGAAVTLAAGGDDAPPAPSSASEAAQLLTAAEAEYFRAVSDYASFAAREEVVDPINRLAALEGILLTTGAALRDAPADPVINNYHMTALGMRDALIRTIEEVDGEEWY